ncbi:MAG: hypothetical protein ABI454_00730 [Sphingomicrobium sp.]
MVRRLLVLALALLLAAQVVRNAAVAALAEKSPVAAFRAWPAHPAVELALGMTEIGTAAHERKAVGPATFAIIDDAAGKAPLAPEPFLVRGVQAELAGNSNLAAQAFAAAEWRDPRSLPAHYFLADLYYRSGDPRRTLEQIAALARLTPSGSQTIAPYLAAYAKNRSAWPYLRELFRSNPGLGDASLTALARDPAYADSVLALADGRHTDGSDWPPALINSLVTARQYSKARTIWAATSHVRLPADPTVYDAAFVDSKSRPPFNWSLVSSTVGLAERDGGGRLHVMFYGHEDGLLAQEMILLSPGAYRMTLVVSGDLSRASAISWSLRCDGAPKPFASVAIDAAAHGWVFSVPPECPAQWLAISGASADIAQQSDVTIGNLKIVAWRPNG